jgi:hypothetical protein
MRVRVFENRQAIEKNGKKKKKNMNQHDLKSEHLAKREIRVFISSTFRDMQEERELLVKKVFPELRRICEERLVSFIEVALYRG